MNSQKLPRKNLFFLRRASISKQKNTKPAVSQRGFQTSGAVSSSRTDDQWKSSFHTFFFLKKEGGCFQRNLQVHKAENLELILCVSGLKCANQAWVPAAEF